MCRPSPLCRRNDMSLTIHDKLALITVNEDVQWQELLERSKLRRHLVKEITPRAIVFERTGVEALISWLKKNGYMPKVSG